MAAVAAASGRKVVLIDLDPRAAATRWFNVEPKAEGLRVVPSARSLSKREADNSDHLEVRLRVALEGLDADLVVIDCANRQAGRAADAERPECRGLRRVCGDSHFRWWVGAGLFGCGCVAAVAERRVSNVHQTDGSVGRGVGLDPAGARY
ncbi:ParA family protein [Arthrobacter halodurans]|uniref:ParA family protein n=1 Tax=Arthrobacter halodurans TaxID=516699 RepID=A0ABV4UMT0_9MICC